MELIVLTSDQIIKDEAFHLNQLFENGLKILHLRKPFFSHENYKELLADIDPVHYQKIVLHKEHELCAEYRLRGIHLQESQRKQLGNKIGTYVGGFKANNYKVSSSFHHDFSIQTCKTSFDYVFLSPLFDSISKSNYAGKKTTVKGIQKKVIGLGGIKASNVKEAKKLGYKGVAALGSIWNSQDPLKEFLTLQHTCQFLTE